jgi:hypothetical protein
MPHDTHSIDRWDDATGSILYEHLAGVNDLLLARAIFAAAVKRWPGAKHTLCNGRAYHRQDVAGGRLNETNGPRISVKNVRVAVLRARDCATATAQVETARTAPRCLPASPPRWNPGLVVSLEEVQRSAAVAVCALYPLAVDAACLAPSAFPSAEPQASRRATGRQTIRVCSGASRTRPIAERSLLARQSQRTPQDQSSQT